MNVLLSPQVGGERLTYEFNGEYIKISNGQIIDVSGVEENKTYKPLYPLTNVERKDGQLYVKLLNEVDADADESELFPEWFTPEDTTFETANAITPVAEEFPEENRRSLQEEIDTLKEALQELVLMTMEGGE